MSKSPTLSKPTSAAEEQRLKAFFRETLKSEPGIGSEQAESMAERCVQSINMVLSRTPAAGKPDVAAATTAASAAAISAFNPFAFSAVALLARQGREVLLARLGEIKEPENLKALALAQHIGIDPSLTRAEEMRIAILRGAERRIASRRAAAS